MTENHSTTEEVAAALGIPAHPEVARTDVIAAALNAIPNLTFSECANFFHEKATPRDHEIVGLGDFKDGEIENDFAITSEGDDNGAYVLAWLWVDFEGTDYDKGLDDDPDEDEE